MPDYDNYPGGTAGGARRWIEDAIEPGSFLMAVLENNLKESFHRADSRNKLLMADIVAWWWNEAPAACWGSEEKVRVWKKLGGWNGINNKTEKNVRFMDPESPGA